MGKYDELVERLRRKFVWKGTSTGDHVNPDGPEAATAITTLEAEVRKQAMDYIILFGEAEDALDRVKELEAELAAMKARGDRLAEALESICRMQTKHYGDGMRTHMALPGLCDEARQALTEWRDQ